MDNKLIDIHKDSWTEDALRFAGSSQNRYYRKPRSQKKQEKMIKLEAFRVTKNSIPQDSNVNRSNESFKISYNGQEGTSLPTISSELIKKAVNKNSEKIRKSINKQDQIQQKNERPLFNIYQKYKQYKDRPEKQNESSIQSAFRRQFLENEKNGYNQTQAAAFQQESQANKSIKTDNHPSEGEISFTSRIFEQYGKKNQKKQVEIISITSDSDIQSNQGLSFHPFQAQNNPKPQPQSNNNMFFIPPYFQGRNKSTISKQNPFKITQRPVAVRTSNASKDKQRNEYQSPISNSNSLDQSNLSCPQRDDNNSKRHSLAQRFSEIVNASTDKNLNDSRDQSRQSKPTDRQDQPLQYTSKSSVKNMPLLGKRRLNNQQKRISASPPLLKHSEPKQFQQNLKKQFQNTQFYIHITLLQPQEVNMKKIQATLPISNAKKVIQNDTMWTSSIKKYKITNTNIKYKQERIDDYFISEDKRHEHLRKNPQETEQEQPSMHNELHYEPEPVIMKEPQTSYNAKKSSKYPKKNHPLAIQGELQLQNVDYSQFLQRRSLRKPRDVGVFTIDQLVEQCYTKELLSQQIYVQYINHTSREKINDFIQLFMEGRMEDWSYYNELKITLMDHRRLAEVLVKAFPSEYIIYRPSALQKDINDFLLNIYLMASSDYSSLLKNLDITSGVTFWRSYNIKFQQYQAIPLIIVPYTPKQTEEIKQKKWNQTQSGYTPAEEKLIQSYRGIREKPKINFSQNVYIETQEVIEQLSSSSQSSLSSEQFQPYYEQTPVPINKNTIKKTGKTSSKQQPSKRKKLP